MIPKNRSDLTAWAIFLLGEFFYSPIFSLYTLCDQIVPVTVKVPVPGVTIQLPVAGSCV